MRSAEQIEMDQCPHAIGEPKPSINIIICFNFQRTELLYFCKNFFGHSEQPEQQIEKVALIEQRPSSQFAACHKKILITFPRMPIGQMGAHHTTNRQDLANLSP